MTHRSPIPAALLLLAPLAASGCAHALAADAGRTVTVSVSAQAPASPDGGPAVLVSSRELLVTSGRDVLAITRIQLVIARMELVRGGAGCASDANAGDDDDARDECQPLALAPALVDLPVDGGVAEVLAVNVPRGDYAGVQAEIRALPEDTGRGAATRRFLARYPELGGVSVIVSGTFNGTRFTWRGAPRADLATRFSPPLAVSDAPVNLTVHADVTTWFKTQSGTVIDPSTANAGGANAALVTDNVRRSLRAFRDDDRNGRDDGDDHAHA